MIPQLRSKETLTETVTLKMRKILIVDEAMPVRRGLLDAFHKMGIPATDIINASTTDEALETFVRTNPSLAFVEFIGDDPADSLQMIQEMLELDPHVRIVLLTAEPRDATHVRAAIRAGAFAFVEKPLRHEKIRAALAEIENETGGIERYR